MNDEGEEEQQEDADNKEDQKHTKKNIAVPNMKLTPKDPFAPLKAPMLDESKVKKELDQQKKKDEKDDRKRSYNSMVGSNTEVTDEGMEAYYRTKILRDDPMLNFPKQ